MILNSLQHNLRITRANAVPPKSRIQPDALASVLMRLLYRQGVFGL